MTMCIHLQVLLSTSSRVSLHTLPYVYLSMCMSLSMEYMYIIGRAVLGFLYRAAECYIRIVAAGLSCR